jgi:transcriptional regulator with XRE-family HTH domain
MTKAETRICECCGQVWPRPTTALGQLVRNKRVAEQLNLREVARNSGCSFTTVSRVENGSTPDLRSLAQLVKWLQLSPQELAAVVAEFGLEQADEPRRAEE